MDSRDRAALTRALQAIYREIGAMGDRVYRRVLPGGRLPARNGGTGTSQGAEPPLGNPASDGQLLSSTTAGARSWIDNGGLTLEQVQDAVAAMLVGSGCITFAYDDAAGTITATVPCVPPPPDTYVYLVDDDGAYIVDDDGAYLWEPA